MCENKPPVIVLASASPRRQELLRLMGIENFVLRVPREEAQCPENLTPQESVEWISRYKNLSCLTEEDAAGFPEPDNELIITADTMVFLDGKPLGKPRDRADALAMLTALQGRSHIVCTGVTLRRGERILTRSQSTRVMFRPANTEELQTYIDSGEPMDKAGAYGIQGRGALLVEGIDGDYCNVMGLPILLLSRMLAEFGVHVGLGGIS